jgi:hypothetical protein
MSLAAFQIREAEPGVDDDAVAALMVDYLNWAIERLAADYGVAEPPTHPSLVRDGLASYRPPVGKLMLAESDGQPVGVGAIRMLAPEVAEVNGCTSHRTGESVTSGPPSLIGFSRKHRRSARLRCFWIRVGS